MANITLQGNPITTIGDLPAVGSTAPSSELCKPDLSNVNIEAYRGKRVLLNIFPSIDTPTCASSVREFNQKAASKENLVVLCISADLPFALGRFCGAEGIDNVVTASSFRSRFGEDYKLTINAGPLAGLLSRAVIILNEEGKVIYTEQVSEIADEPDYNAALSTI